MGMMLLIRSDRGKIFGVTAVIMEQEQVVVILRLTSAYTPGEWRCIDRIVYMKNGLVV